MSSIIHVLDEATANKIAAGEVVERPASVIKEMVENALDAGATAIETEIADGGQTYMRVSDNGSGMSREDAKKCIIRHGTSKISTIEDIFSMSSLGFRGEAVPSIAAVSRLTITTRTEDDEFAFRLTLAGGTVTGEEQTGAAVGTTMEVSDLFFNTPARKKFMKSERTESSKISDILTKLALTRPDVSFTFINNGRTSVHTGGNGNALDAVAAVYGASVAKEVFEEMFRSDIDPEKYVEEKGLKVVNDEGALRETIEKVIADNPQSVEDYHNGKKKAMGFLVGQTMKAMKGKANPAMVNAILQELLA